jgi:hypothetical protein
MDCAKLEQIFGNGRDGPPPIKRNSLTRLLIHRTSGKYGILGSSSPKPCPLLAKKLQKPLRLGCVRLRRGVG